MSMAHASSLRGPLSEFWPVLSFSLLFMLLLSCSGQQVLVEEEQDIGERIEAEKSSRPEVESVKIITDKPIYKSGEIMHMTIEIDSRDSSVGLNLAVYGLYVRGKPLIYSVAQLNITEGKTMARYDFKMPTCNRCAGINPGNYTINAELYYANQMLASGKEKVGLKQ